MQPLYLLLLLPLSASSAASILASPVGSLCDSPCAYHASSPCASPNQTRAWKLNRRRMRKRKKEDGEGEKRWSGVEIENIAGGDT
jgi:hypothetical protein